MYPIFTSKEGIKNERCHLTANTNAAKLDFGWTSIVLIRGKGYTASPPCSERRRGISIGSIAASECNTS
jgi:hypothetical protein